MTLVFDHPLASICLILTLAIGLGIVISSIRGDK